MKIIGPMAGIGARLRPFTYSKPKGFLKVAGKRVIDHILDLFMEISHKGTDLLIITGYRDRAIKSYLYGKYGGFFNLEFKPQPPKGYRGDIPYFGGLGEAIYITREWYSRKIGSFDSDDPDDIAVIFLSDMIPLDGFGGIYNRILGVVPESPEKIEPSDDFKDDRVQYREYLEEIGRIEEGGGGRTDKIDGVIGTMLVPKERASSYGIIELDNRGIIKRMVEKPKEYISNIAIAGVYVFRPRAMKALYEYLEKEVESHKNIEGEAQLTPALQGLVDSGFKLVPYFFRRGILDFGKPDTLLEGNRYLLEHNGNVMGGPLAEVKHSTLVSPSFIGADTVIENCIIGPYVSIGDRCRLKDCILRNCVIGDECILEKIITSASIIGDNVIMENLVKDDLIIGDNSNISSSKK